MRLLRTDIGRCIILPVNSMSPGQRKYCDFTKTRWVHNRKRRWYSVPAGKREAASINANFILSFAFIYKGLTAPCSPQELVLVVAYYSHFYRAAPNLGISIQVARNPSFYHRPFKWRCCEPWH